MNIAAILRVALKMILAEFGRHGERGMVAPYVGVSGERRYDLSLLSSSRYSIVLRVYTEALQAEESCWSTIGVVVCGLILAVAAQRIPFETNGDFENYVSTANTSSSF